MGKTGQRAARIPHHIPTALWRTRFFAECPGGGSGATGEASLAVTREGVFMKRSWTAMAVPLTAIFAAMGCNDYGNTFQVPTGASISALSPSNISAGSPQFTLTVTGGGFVAKTVVQWNGQTIATQVQTDANGNVLGITATVPASLVAKPGTAFVNTLQPHSGAGTNGLSNPLAFIINPPGNPLPTISAISPTCAIAGSAAAFTLTVTGSNLLPTSDPSGGSQVLWSAGGTQTTLTSLSGGSATQVQATVPSTLIASVVPVSVSVFNPPAPNAGTGNGGGGTSPTSSPFTIASVCPALSSHPAAATQSVGEETPAVSADRRFVAFTAAQGEHLQIFVRDTCQGATEACQARTLLVSSAMDG